MPHFYKPEQKYFGWFDGKIAVILFKELVLFHQSIAAVGNGVE